MRNLYKNLNTEYNLVTPMFLDNPSPPCFALPPPLPFLAKVFRPPPPLLFPPILKKSAHPFYEGWGSNYV